MQLPGPGRAEPRLLVNGYAETNYNIAEFEGDFYALHRADGAFDIEKIKNGDTSNPVYVGCSLDDVAAQIERNEADHPRGPGITTKTLQNIITGFGWRGRRGLSAEVGPHPNDFLLYAFFGSMKNVGVALCVALRGTTEPVNLLGDSGRLAPIYTVLKNEGISTEMLDWRYGESLPLLPQTGRLILCEVPQTHPDYLALFELRKQFSSISTIWELTFPIAVVREVISLLDYNVGNPDRINRIPETLAAHEEYFAIMCDVYSAKRSFLEPLPRIIELLNLKGRTVIEFGPSDGIHTGFLIASGARQVTVVEGRPENVLKLLAAKYGFGWENLEILIDNFQYPGIWAERRYDAVFAHGVFYHCMDPFYFFDQLTRISDTIFLGGWVATDTKPLSDWQEFPYGERVYRVQAYQEVAHFCAGLTTISICPDAESVEKFFSERKYRPVLQEVAPTNAEFTDTFMHWIFKKTDA